MNNLTKQNRFSDFLAEREVIAQWSDAPLMFYVCKHPSWDRHKIMQFHCGYVLLPVRPVKEDGYNGVLSCVPVHGGITFAHQFLEGMVYGFDCGHAGDDRSIQCSSLEWLIDETARMAKMILVAAAYEDDYNMSNDWEHQQAIYELYYNALIKLGIIEES